MSELKLTNTDQLDNLALENFQKQSSETNNHEYKIYTKQVIVIGSGFGGLSAAIRLQSQGYQVTILERRDQIGGRAGVYKLDGFTFDAGPTVITAPFLIEELFTLAGKKMHEYVELLPVWPYYRIFFNDKSYFDYAHPDDNIKAIQNFSPDDLEGYKKMINDVKPIFEKGNHSILLPVC